MSGSSSTPNVVVLPVDFVVFGVPASAQASGRTKETWKRKVRHEALASLPGYSTPTLEEVQIHVVYYHEEDSPLDVDNMIKPIQDALCGVIYKDDSQIQDTHGSRRAIDDRFQVRGMSPAVAKGFVAGTAFVNVRVSAAPDPSELI